MTRLSKPISMPDLQLQSSLKKQRSFEETTPRAQENLRPGREFAMKGKGKDKLGNSPIKSEQDLGWSPKRKKKDDPF